MPITAKKLNEDIDIIKRMNCKKKAMCKICTLQIPINLLISIGQLEGSRKNNKFNGFHISYKSTAFDFIESSVVKMEYP